MNFKPPPFEPVKFTPSAQKQEMLDLNVNLLYVVCHETLAEGGNHWCMYLDTGNERSVQTDTVPSYSIPSVKISGGSKAFMLINYLPYTISPSAQKIVGIKVRAGIKVQEFVDLLIQQNRYRYQFDAADQGCRYWTDDQITLFQKSGLIVDSSQILEAREAILTKYPSQVRYPLVVGNYY